MGFLQQLLPDPNQLRLDSGSLDTDEQSFTLKVTSVQSEAYCPVCQTASRRIHSRYQRTLQDLPCMNYKVTLLVQVRKFFCLNPNCQRRIFTERHSQLTETWARRTSRLAQHLVAIGLALGGKVGVRLSQHLSHPVSLNPLLQLLNRLSLPAVVTPKTLGVDDFAFRKGQTYGTLLVDLDQNRPIALLADRKAQTLAQWLQQHPGVEVLSRDRSKEYKQGMTQGAPNATQVADRFHLLKNLTEVLQQVLALQGKVLKLAQAESIPQAPIERANLETRQQTAHPTLKAQQQSQQCRAQRLQTYQLIWQLHLQGYGTAQIAQQAGVSSRTVQRYLQASSFPERQARSDRGRSLVSTYQDYLIQQWNQGHHGMRSLFRGLQQQGYGGSYMSVVRYLRQFQQQPEQDDAALTGAKPGKPLAQRQTLTARRASYLIVQNPQTRTVEDEQLLHRLIEQNPSLTPAIEFAQAFAQLVRQRQPKQLDLWLQQAKVIGIEPFQRFAKSLQEDYEAVKAGVTLAVSNGQVEGQINRLKMLKRQMYGRANIKLLERRFLLAS